MIIGITGGLATGTSTAAKYIASCLKAGIISADKIAHAHLGSDKLLIKKIIGYFGKDILNSQNAIDRKQLAKKAFANKRGHKTLCRIMHPVIIRDIENSIKRLHKQGLHDVVIDGPLIIESEFYKKCDCVIVVTAALSLQVHRCRDKKIPVKDALSRIEFQMPLSEKARHADYIIDNSGSMEELRTRCMEVSEKIRRSFPRTKFICKH